MSKSPIYKNEIKGLGEIACDREQLTKDELMNDAVHELGFDDEDVQLHLKAHPHLVRVDGTGWLSRKEVTILRDWLNEVLSA